MFNFFRSRIYYNTCVKQREQLLELLEMFPFKLGQEVYDVQLRNAQGKYTKKKPSIEHCLINKVVVDEKNYFSIVKRFRNNDVFLDFDTADAYLMDICEDSTKDEV